MIDKNRLLAITDGVVAIAATIMVLQLTIPEIINMGSILEQWPLLLGYIISFTQVFLAWHEHHDSVANAEMINHRIFLINCMWLFFITLLPFVTGLAGHAGNYQPAMLMYILVLFMVQLSITIESRSICKLNNTEILDGEVIRIIRIVSFVGYPLAAASTFWNTLIAYIIILAVSIIEIALMCAYDIKIGKLIKQAKHDNEE